MPIKKRLFACIQQYLYASVIRGFFIPSGLMTCVAAAAAARPAPPAPGDSRHPSLASQSPRALPLRQRSTVPATSRPHRESLVPRLPQSQSATRVPHTTTRLVPAVRYTTHATTAPTSSPSSLPYPLARQWALGNGCPGERRGHFARLHPV